ncbi:hypothetical protein B7Y94_00595 [Candidatus Saccharibacteria bacterium 32-49-12]|nr:MAG: hypothetical protein B7Y94_00595 [Candidatus Saccharibacteria bacterium 32-49-12]
MENQIESSVAAASEAYQEALYFAEPVKPGSDLMPKDTQGRSAAEFGSSQSEIERAVKEVGLTGELIAKNRQQVIGQLTLSELRKNFIKAK